MNINEINGIDRVPNMFYAGLIELLNEMPKNPLVKRISVFGPMVDIDEKNIDRNDEIMVAVDIEEKNYTMDEIDKIYDQIDKNYKKVVLYIIQDPGMKRAKLVEDVNKGVLLYEAKTSWNYRRIFYAWGFN